MSSFRLCLLLFLSSVESQDGDPVWTDNPASRERIKTLRELAVANQNRLTAIKNDPSTANYISLADSKLQSEFESALTAAKTKVDEGILAWRVMTPSELTQKKADLVQAKSDSTASHRQKKTTLTNLENFEISNSYLNDIGNIHSVLFNNFFKDPALCSKIDSIYEEINRDFDVKMTKVDFGILCQDIEKLSDDVSLTSAEQRHIKEAFINAQLDSDTCSKKSATTITPSGIYEYLKEVAPALTGPLMFETSFLSNAIAKNPDVPAINNDVKLQLLAQAEEYFTGKRHLIVLKSPEENTRNVLDRLSTNHNFLKLKSRLGDEYSQAQTTCLMRKIILDKLLELTAPVPISGISIASISLLCCAILVNGVIIGVRVWKRHTA